MPSYTHEPLTPERVVVDRGNGQTFGAITTHKLFYENTDEKTGKPISRGKFLAIGIRTDKGHDLYAQLDQLKAVEK